MNVPFRILFELLLISPVYGIDQICSMTACGKYSYKYILRRFPGIFFTEEQSFKQEKTFSLVREKYLDSQNVDVSRLLGDGDSCCPTEIQTFANLTMENIYGEKRYIMHMPPKYQFISHGFCLDKGTCDGICAIEPVTRTLLAYNPDENVVEFDQFVVPGYCSCKSQKMSNEL